MPAATVTLVPKVTVKTPEANEAVLLRAKGAVNVQTGVLGKPKPGKEVYMEPAAPMAVAAVKVTVTATPETALAVLDKVMAAFVRAPTAVTATRVHAAVESNVAVKAAVLVLMEMSVLAA